mgnify:CR=1 FL=1
MNIAFFLIPKQNVAFLYDDFTLRQGLEKMRFHGYTAIPVVTRKNEYIGTVSEGDFLWHLIDDRKDKDLHKINIQSIENMLVRDIISKDKNPPVRITATVEELIHSALTQNFIPVIDDRDLFIGIVTRSDLIKHYLKTTEQLKAAVLQK